MMRIPAKTRKKPARKADPLARQEGFTLIEVLVTLLILSTNLILVLQAYQSSLRALGASRTNLHVSALLGQRVAEIEKTILLNPGRIPQSAQGVFFGHYANYSWSQNVQEVAGSVDSEKPKRAPGYLCEVSITIWRTDSRDRYESTTLVYVPPEPEEKP